MYGLTNYRNNENSIFDPFKDLFGGLFSDDMSENSCRTDIRDEGDRYIIESELPGFNKEDISVDISDGYMTVSAEHSTETRAIISAVNAPTVHSAVPLTSRTWTLTISPPNIRTAFSK